MTLVLVEALTEAALEYLRQINEIQVVGIVNAPDAPLSALPTAPAPRKWAGALAELTPDAGAAWDKHLTEIRNEWERDI